MINAVIFDMDGVIINSEPIQSKAFEQVIKDYGKKPQLQNNGLVQIPGLRSSENWDIIKKTHGINEDTIILIEKRRLVYQTLLQSHLISMPGVLSFLTFLKKHNYKIALASSSANFNIDMVLSGLKITSFFQVIVSGENVKKSKPDPDIYLETAHQLNTPPKQCLVIEDTYAGVIAAKAAGMKVVAVPNKYTKKLDFSIADLIVKSLLSKKLSSFILKQ